MSTVAKVFIPRVLGGVHMSSIRTAFMDSKIGKPTSIDMHRKLNEKNNRYSFVFIDIHLFDTDEANAFSESLNTRGVYQLHYDRKNYWEVKSFLKKKDRTNKKAATLTDVKPPPVMEEEYDAMLLQSEMNISIPDVYTGIRNAEEPRVPRFLPMFAKHAAEMEADFQAIDEDCHALIVPTQELNPAASQFIPMFLAIEENDAIETLCRELATKPSAFTALVRAGMNAELDDLLMCIHSERNSIVV